MALFEQWKPSLVLLDVMLPGRDGWSILNLIWRLFVDFIGQVKQNRGVFAVVCDDKTQHTLLKSKLGLDVYSDYDHIDW